MILDKLYEFADATALQTSDFSTTTVTGNVIDLESTSNFLGRGEPLYLIVQVDTSVTSDGSATVTFYLQSDSTADLATSATTHWQSSAIGKATLVAGYEVCCIALPGGTYERYLGVTHLPGTAALTAGKVNAFITTTPRAWSALPDGI